MLNSKNNNEKNNNEKNNNEKNNNEDKNIADVKYRLNKINSLIIGSGLEELYTLRGLNNNVDTLEFNSKMKISNDLDNDTRSVLGKVKIKMKQIIMNMGATLVYIKSGGYGHTFKGTICDDNGKEKFVFALKMVAYTKRKEYGDEYNLQRPENTELVMLKALSYFVIMKSSPHIILPICSFYTDITPFIHLPDKKLIDTETKNYENYRDFINRYKEGKYYETVSVIISEWANEGDLSMFLKKNYKKLKLIHWKCLFFQIISVLAIIQKKYPPFRHNDLKLNNILISTTSMKTRQFNFDNHVFVVPSIGYMIYLWDFDFSCISGTIENLKVQQKCFNQLNITSKENKYYDIHYLFGTLITKAFLPNFLEDKNVPSEVKEFVNFVVPPEYRYYKGNKLVNDKYRLQQNIELHTPNDLMHNKFFSNFKIK